MRVTVSIEHRLAQGPDGRILTQTMFPYRFWRRYLGVFSRVRVAARVERLQALRGDWLAVEGDGVEVMAVPNYVGPWQYVLNRAAVSRTVAELTAAEHDAYILRVPSFLGTLIWKRVLRTRPYAVEVVGDPWDIFSPGAFRHPLRPLFRHWYTSAQRGQCAHAVGAAYVTRYTLQERYPCSGPPHRAPLITSYSSVELQDEAFVSAPRTFSPSRPSAKLLFVGSLGHFQKAPDILLQALHLVARRRADVRLTLLGDGRCRDALEAQAGTLGVADRVRFAGQVSAGRQVRAELDDADLFVLPSRHEGLPRAMLEAMARALPCIGSCVGGIPELLPPEDMVPAGDADALAARILEVLADPERMTRSSLRNLQTAQSFRDEHLQQRRQQFYRFVRDRTAEWVGMARPACLSGLD